MITVFTPIYNRAYIVERLYRSLLDQTCYDFEWLVVDDGSEDDIVEVIASWMNEKETQFDIRLYRQQNGGKHRAINKGVELARGEAFFIVDSDDYLEKDAIEKISKWWTQIDNIPLFAGVAGLRGYHNREVVGDIPSFRTYVDATNLERARYNLLGDKAEVYRTSILKKNPFPEFEGENFLTEAVVWDKIAHDGYKIRWFNEVIYICEYREDGLTFQRYNYIIRNPRGWSLYIRQRCVFYQLSPEEKLNQYFSYYIDMKDNLTEYDIQKYLSISDEQFSRVKNYCKKYNENTIKSIGKNIAIYGVGIRGKKILSLYKQSDVKISFILDKRESDLPYKQLELESEYPQVDALIITPKDNQDEIYNFLRKKTNNKLIGYDEWKLSIGLYPEF